MPNPLPLIAVAEDFETFYKRQYSRAVGCMSGRQRPPMMAIGKPAPSKIRTRSAPFRTMATSPGSSRSGPTSATGWASTKTVTGHSLWPEIDHC